MKTYAVTVPFTGTMFIEVQAENEDDAIETALSEVTSEHIEGWNAVRKIVQGNVFHGEQNDASAEEITED